MDGAEATSPPRDAADLARAICEAAHQLAGLASTRQQVPPAPRPPGDEELAACALELYRRRRRRTSFFHAGLFGEPAWDMLLDLFIAELNGKPLTTTALCVGSGVALTTGLRWLTVLEAHGLAQRSPADNDRRCNYVALTTAGDAAMRAYLAALIVQPAAPAQARAA